MIMVARSRGRRVGQLEYIYGWRHIPRAICDAFAYGNKATMKIYTNTYNYILRENRLRNGYYRINYKPCLTESIPDC